MVSMIFTGMRISLRLKKRVCFLSDTVLFISQVSMDIEYVNLPLYEILKKAAEGNCCSSLDFIPLCLELWQQGEDFAFSWERSLELSHLPMNKQEKQRLKNLGSLLGTSDVNGQKNMLSLYSSYFTAYYEKAAEEYEKYGKMCVTLSTVAGTGIFILLI